MFAEPFQAGRLVDIPTSVFIIQTMGLEPARLGTQVVPAFPPGPLPNIVTIRTRGPGDYGIDRRPVEHPQGPRYGARMVRNLHVVLCERAPCVAANRFKPADGRSDRARKAVLREPDVVRHDDREALEAKSYDAA